MVKRETVNNNNEKKLVVGITAHVSVVLIEGQLKYFKDLGYSTYLLAPTHERVTWYCELEGCTHLPIEIEREISIWKDLKTFFQIIRHFRKIKPDVVNLGTPKVSLLGMVAARMLGVNRRIYTCRGYRFEHEKGIKRAILVMMERITALFAQDIICISESVRAFGLDNKLFPARKAVVINKGSSNGMDLNRFNPESVPESEIVSLRNKLGYNGCFVYGFVGRLVDRKGINELFNAFENLYSKDTVYRLLVVGSIETEQLADKSLIERMRQHPGVFLAGPQMNVPLYLSVMDVFVLPAWWEGFGNVLIQAAAMGIPVISTNATGTRDAVNKDYNGLLVAPGSVKELETAMKTLHDDRELSIMLGMNGKKWALNFDRRIIWQGMEALFQKKG